MMWRLILPGFLVVAACTTEEPAKPAAPPAECKAAGCITTVIGTGKAEFGDDDVAGWKSAIYTPQDMTTGPDGKLYYIDWNNHRIRVLAPDAKPPNEWLTTTLVGTGELGDLGAGGPPLKARMNHPTSLAFDGSGRLLIAAWHNSKIKRVDLKANLLEDICGTGARAFGGDGVVGGAKAARLDLPSGIALDSKQELYLADQANQRIRKVDGADTITTVIGAAWWTDTGKKEGAAQLDKSGKYYTDCSGALIADLDKHAVVKDLAIKDASGKRVEQNTWSKQKDAQGNPIPVVLPALDLCGGFGGDGGPMAEARIMSPKAQSAYPAGRIHITKQDVMFIADSGNNRIRKADLKAGTIDTLAGTGTAGYAGDGGPAKEAQFNSPVDVDELPDGRILVADLLNHCIRAIDKEGKIATFAGQCGKRGFSGDGGGATAALLNTPFAIHVDPKGDVWVADSFNQRIRRVLGSK